MNLSEKICIILSDLCSKLPIPRPETPPTNTDAHCEKEFRTAKEFEKICRKRMNFENSCVLDLGCGSGGQTVYFALQGTKITVGVDISVRALPKAVAFAKKRRANDKVDFIKGDATHLPFRENTFEIIVMYHVIEHLPEVSKALQECKRTLKQCSLLCVAFPSWLYPYGAHLWNYIPIPWCHLLFSGKTLVNVMQKIGSSLPDKEISHEIEQFQNLSKITIGQFQKIVEKTDFEIVFYEEELPLRILSILRFFPLFIREFFASNAVCILKKPPPCGSRH